MKGLMITVAVLAAGCSAHAAGGGPRDPGSTPVVVPCSELVTRWAAGPGYKALDHLNDLVWNPVDIRAGRLRAALTAVQARPLPGCVPGSRWKDMVKEVKRAIVTARAGNDGSAAGAEGGAAADIMTLGFKVMDTGYDGKFPG